jgi:hypothetical protein
MQAWSMATRQISAHLRPKQLRPAVPKEMTPFTIHGTGSPNDLCLQRHAGKTIYLRKAAIHPE